MPCACCSSLARARAQRARCRAACGRWRPRRPARTRRARAPAELAQRVEDRPAASGGEGFGLRRAAGRERRRPGRVRAARRRSTLARQHEARRPLALHHGAAGAGEDDQRALAAREVDPARRDAAPQQLREPRLRRGLAARRRSGVRSRPARVSRASGESGQQLDRGVEAETPIDRARRPRAPCARSGVVSASSPAVVAPESADRRRSGRSRRASRPRRRSSAGSRRGGSCRPRPSASARGTGPTCARRPRAQAAASPSPDSSSRRRSGRSPGECSSSPNAGAPSRPARPTSW